MDLGAPGFYTKALPDAIPDDMLPILKYVGSSLS